MPTNLRALVVGASSLLGKELVEELSASATPWDLQLADTAQANAQLTAAGDEALVVHPLTPEMFEGSTIVFFAADAHTTRAHWKEAAGAGASIVDLTGALENEPHAQVRSPWIRDAVPNKPALTSDITIVIPAHPAAVILGLIAARLRSAFQQVRLAATVLEPASQQGSQGLEEMHQQTVSLLGLHSLPQEIYDAQVAFNLRVNLGDEAKLDLGEISRTIRRHIKIVADQQTASSIAIQLVQAPVFHGYAMSIYAELPANADPASVRRALDGSPITVTNAAEDAPSNQSVMQDPGISIALSEDSAHSPDTRAFWLWTAADNLKLAARNSIACAEELVARRASKAQ
jgi:aspartate-semialdehyde dehydrogenase